MKLFACSVGESVETSGTICDVLGGLSSSSTQLWIPLLRKKTCVAERLRSCCTRFKLKRVGHGCNGSTAEETIPLAECALGAQPSALLEEWDQLNFQNEEINPECHQKNPDC